MRFHIGSHRQPNTHQNEKRAQNPLGELPCLSGFGHLRRLLNVDHVFFVIALTAFCSIILFL